MDYRLRSKGHGYIVLVKKWWGWSRITPIMCARQAITCIKELTK